jgi:phasin
MANPSKKSAATQAAAAPQLEPDLPNEIPTAAEAVEAIVEPAIEMQETVRSALQKGVVESRAAFAKAKVSAEEATSALELSLAAAKDGTAAFNAKALAAARANAEASFNLVKAALGARSVADLFALQSDFARKQTEAVVVQFKDLAELAQKTIAETIEPIKDQLTKSLNIAA